MTCWWCLTAVEFFKSFWPNLLATLGGVLIGVPVALWLTGRAREYQAREERAANDERLSHALEVLAVAIQDNLGLLKESRDGIAKGYVTGLPLNVSAWDAAKSDITPLLRDTKLKVLAAHHFEQLGLFGAHVERHAEYFIGTRATLMSAPKIREGLGRDLIPFADRLIAEVEELLKRFGETRARLTPSTAAGSRLTP